MGRPKTYYEQLGVAPTASAADIRAAYRTLARTLHPDRARGQASSRMASINEAWRVLGDPTRRAAYDDELARAEPHVRPRSEATRSDAAPRARQQEAAEEEAAADEEADDWRLDVPITDGRAVRALGLLVAVAGALAVAVVGALFAYAILWAG
ncbi:MAG TPA: J domain-containing protein [Acidimicrobiia bacterium]